MPESSLSLRYIDLKAAAGLFLGWGRGSDFGDVAYDTRKSSLLDQMVRSGLRQFYFPAPTEKNGVSYEWSFLRPSTTLTLASGAQSIDLPDDFGGFDGPLYVSNDTGTNGLPVEITGMARVRQARVLTSDSTGRPVLAAVDPVKGTTAGRGQRHTLEVYPLADAAYTLYGAYHIHPEALSGDRPYAYGGPQHAETIQAAVIAAAELYLDDTKSVRKDLFMERLATSISQDRKLKPQVQGYNGDRSNRKYGSSIWGRQHGDAPITYNGQTPT